MENKVNLFLKLIEVWNHFNEMLYIHIYANYYFLSSYFSTSNFPYLILRKWF